MTGRQKRWNRLNDLIAAGSNATLALANPIVDRIKGF